MIPATIPEVLRTSVKPNRPTRSDSRYPPRVARANPAPAAAASHQPVAAIRAASAKAVMTWSRNSQPIVGTVR